MLAKMGLVDVFLSKVVKRGITVDEDLERAVEVARDALGDFVYGFEGDTLASVVGDQLRQMGWSLATAESCTGGLIGAEITSVSGSSDYYTHGYVTYSNEAKMEALGVPEEGIRAHGAVSEAVARAMAEGARVRSGADIGISVTGIAGPGGGTEQKPVGTVWFGLADREGSATFHQLYAGSGREAVRVRSCTAALDNLRKHLLKRRQSKHG
jgi:PncC family amidohydrolase